MATNEASSAADASDDLRVEYDLDYTRSRPNRFASERGPVVPPATLKPMSPRSSIRRNP